MRFRLSSLVGVVVLQVNSMQTKIKRMTRQMMAKVSELSMYQASAMRLQQEMHEKQALLERYAVNMEQGLPPSVDIEQEFLRQIHLEQQRQRDRHNAKLVYELTHNYSGGFVVHVTV